MTLPQLIDAATSPLAILIATAILAVVVQPWLAAHRAQVQALTASIKDSHLRMAAETVVRWLETDPAMAQLPGLIQRANGITLLAKRTGLPESTVATYLDAGYNYLKGSGQLLVAPTPPPTPAGPEPSTLADFAALLAPFLRPPSAAGPPDPSPPIQDGPPSPPPTRVPGVTLIAVPQNLPETPPATEATVSPPPVPAEPV